VSKVLETSDEEWTRIVELLPGRNIYLTREYSQLFEKYFCKRARLFVFGDDNNFVVHPIWERERSIYPTRGFLQHFAMRSLHGIMQGQR